MSWRSQRRFSIVLAVAMFFAVVFGGWYYFHKPEPSCTDSLLNQGEIDIDCGGPCAKVCRAEVLPLVVLWTRANEIKPGVYSVVSYIENPNRSVGIPELPFEIVLVDAEGQEVVKTKGKSFANPKEGFVIFEGNISAPAGLVIGAFLEFSDTLVWRRLEARQPNVVVQKKGFETEPVPRLIADITNLITKPVSNIVIPVVISDKEGNVISSSATVVDTVAGGQTTEIYFTWPLALPSEPVFFDFYPRQNFYND